VQPKPRLAHADPQQQKLRSALHTLDVPGTTYLEKGGILQKMASLENLRCLYVGPQSFKEGSLAEILRGRVKNSLRTLDFSWNTNLDRAARQAISALALRDLDLEECNPAAGDLVEILSGRIKSSLRMLGLNENSNLRNRPAISRLFPHHLIINF
jgi:hypothetical protein